MCATVPLIVSDDVDAAADALRPFYALYFGGMGAKGTNFHANVAIRMGYEKEIERDPGAVPRRQEGRGGREDPARADRGDVADRAAREDPRRPRALARVDRDDAARHRRRGDAAHGRRAGARLSSGHPPPRRRARPDAGSGMTDGDALPPAAARQLPVRDLRARARRRAPELPLRRAARTRAREELSPEAFGYVAGGAGAEGTMRANPRRSSAGEIVPRMLRDVSARDLSGTSCSDGDARAGDARAGGRAVDRPPRGRARGGPRGAALGLPFILSTAASHSIEEVAEAMGEASRWYQLYWPRDRELAASFVDRAEAGRLRRRSWSRSTRGCSAGARATCRRLPAVPARRGRGELLQRPGVPGRAGKPAGGGPRGGGRALGVAVLQPDGDLGGPGVAARADRAADRAEGDPPRRRRAARGASAGSTA